MKSESTYNKYKRERNELKNIVSVDVQEFLLGRKDFEERLKYIKKCLVLYRARITAKTERKDG